MHLIQKIDERKHYFQHSVLDALQVTVKTTLLNPVVIIRQPYITNIGVPGEPVPFDAASRGGFQVHSDFYLTGIFMDVSFLRRCQLRLCSPEFRDML